MEPRSIFLLIIFLAVNFYSCNKDEEQTPKSSPQITTLVPTNVSTTSATVGGTITDDGNVAISGSGVVYSSNVALPTLADNRKESTVTNGSFTVDLTGLTSGTTYHVRAFATNSVGTTYGELVDFTTGNLAPVISDLRTTGTLQIGETLTAMYAYADAENDLEGATTYQWYVASGADGTGEMAIDGATSNTFTIEKPQNGKYLRVSVFPKASTGTPDGAEVKSSYTTMVGAEYVTFDYGLGEAKVTVTYGTIISAATGRKWLDRNLGASQVAQSATDYLAFGDQFQWGRLADGHQLIIRTSADPADAVGVTGITSTVPPYEFSDTDVPTTLKFIINADLSSTRDWRTTPNDNLWQGVSGTNNPCPDGWRIATREEWVAEGITSGPDGFKKLKLTYGGGRRYSVDGTIGNNEAGYYWTSTRFTVDNPDPDGNAWRAGFVAFDEKTADQSPVTNNPRGNGSMCRCIKDE
jgi:hypothetical protein